MTTEEFTRMVAGLSPSGSNPAADLAGDAIESLDSLIGMAREALRAAPEMAPEVRMDDEDQRVTAARRMLDGDVGSGLVPGVEVGGVQVCAWRQDGTLHFDVNLEDADPDAFVLTEDGHELAVTGSVAGVIIYRDTFPLENACDECGASTADGEGYDGLCGNCADRAEAAGRWS